MGPRERREERRTEPKKQIQASINRTLRQRSCRSDILSCRYSSPLPLTIARQTIYISWMEMCASPQGVVHSQAMPWHVYANRIFLEISKVKEWASERDGFELDLTDRKKIFDSTVHWGHCRQTESYNKEKRRHGKSNCSAHYPIQRIWSSNAHHTNIHIC